MDNSTDKNNDNRPEQNLVLRDIQVEIKQLQEEVKEMRQIMEDMRYQLRAAESTQWKRILDLQAEIIQAKVQANINTRSKMSWAADIVGSGILIATMFFVLLVLRENLAGMY